MRLPAVSARIVVTLVVAASLLSAPLGVSTAAGASAVPEAETSPARKKARCEGPRSGFRPTAARIAGIKRPKKSKPALRVVRVRRTTSGAVGTPPLTRAGKWMVGWDRATRPGSGQGSVILVAHTWPDGSALGNAMLRRTTRGDRIVVRGADGKRACYRVTKRASYPARKVPRRKAFRYWGPEQLVIVVCSGKRLGPGNWARRTIFYATPDRG